ncbi:hypothetical protein NLG97_g4719 [Lecanicillium saksenae]|uniref:Uncharacterized protein n=1 Tax=Lecanicillium saksenae TaxID=468837 RepID=A0ACC1QWB6_9HYPO|nr:hypothetical protein NLG97_g4719 [Lecanicillium saksenae]
MTTRGALTTTIGPLTTTFTPSPSCTDNPGYTEFAGKNVSSYMVRGPAITATGCYPSRYTPGDTYLYTPGLCPSGYSIASLALLDITTVPVTSAYCCPVLETGKFDGILYRKPNETIPREFACVQTITNTTTVMQVTQVSDGTTLSTVTSTITAATIGAYGVQIQFNQDDEMEKPPDPERFNNVRLSFPTYADTHDQGLGPEAQVGVGVGICFAIGSIGMGIVLFLKRSRNSSHRKATSSVSVLSTPDTHSSVPHTCRKPIASATALQPIRGMQNSYKEYYTISLNDTEDDNALEISRQKRQLAQPVRGISLWAWEILSLLFATLSLACIIIILRVYEDRQLEDWTPRISINAVISILSAVFKGSLAVPITEGISQLKWLIFAKRPQKLSEFDVYDKASRGAWGSVMMILGMLKSGPRAYLASFGAVLGLVALASDPFAQATISLYSCVRNGTEPAVIPLANRFTLGEDSSDAMNVNAFNTAMELASYRGVLEPPMNRSASISASCTSGNCTFPSDQDASFISLTMCSKAWDISDRVRMTEATRGYTFAVGPATNLSLPSTFGIGYVEAPDTGFQAAERDFWNRTSLVDVYLISMIKDNSTDCEGPMCQVVGPLPGRYKPSAFIFSLFPCVQTISATYAHGRFEEKVISEEYLHYISNGDGGIYQLALDRTMLNGKWQNCAGTKKPTDRNTITGYIKNNYTAKPSKMWYAPECVFQFVGSTFLSQFLGPTFFVRKGRPPSWMNQLWRNGTTDLDLVSQFAEGIATSLGGRIRDGAIGPDMLREVRGTTQLTKTCIRIHWGYVTFFAAIFVLEVLFLSTVIIMSYKSKLHTDWKSSALVLAFLSTQHAGPAGWRADNPDSEESLRQAAESVEGTLYREAGKWKLITREKS